MFRCKRESYEIRGSTRGTGRRRIHRTRGVSGERLAARAKQVDGATRTRGALDVFACGASQVRAVRIALAEGTGNSRPLGIEFVPT